MPCKTLTLVVFRTKYLMLLQDINQVTPRDTVYSRGKGVCEQKTTDCCLRQSVGQKRSYRGPRGILCTRGEKEHTSKRINKQKTNKQIKSVCLVKSAVCDVAFGDRRELLHECAKPRPRVARFAFEITLSLAITLTLLLVCSFSPRVHSIPRGPQNYTRQSFD